MGATAGETEFGETAGNGDVAAAGEGAVDEEREDGTHGWGVQFNVVLEHIFWCCMYRIIARQCPQHRLRWPTSHTSLPANPHAFWGKMHFATV